LQRNGTMHCGWGLDRRLRMREDSASAVPWEDGLSMPLGYHRQNLHRDFAPKPASLHPRMAARLAAEGQSDAARR